MPRAGQVVEVPVEATFALRELLLRADRPDLELCLPDDRVPGAFHLAVADAGGLPVAVVTLTPSRPPFPLRRPCYRLRQMAVHPDWQGRGVGSALLDAAFARLRSGGAASLWAESRDTSLGFYRSHGMAVVPGRRHRVGAVTYTDVAVDLAPGESPGDQA